MRIPVFSTRGLLMILPILSSIIIASENPEPKKWPEKVATVAFASSTDARLQSALFYNSGTEKRKPLLVALHTWSADYTQTMSIPYAEWCIENDWIFIHPNFRGPNNQPEATGSEQVLADILSAVQFARKNSPVDSNRIYLVGCSGGGYTALLAAARIPQIWAGVSAWVPITSLEKWYDHCAAVGLSYATDLVNSCGGVPGTNKIIDQEFRLRSPLTYLNKSLSVPIDINAGIHDGHTGSVPIQHSLEAFNALADEADKISESDIQFFVENAAVPLHLQTNIEDRTFEEKKPLFRRQSRSARVTIFKGGHEIVFRAALDWLSRQQKNNY
jgi:hypothetical protein